MGSEGSVGPSARDWANASLHVTKIENQTEETIYEFRKELIINGVRHLQFVWLNQMQLRSVGIDQGL
jgi:hypothetical protein